MTLFEVGRVCVKLAGRDAGKTCVIIERIDDKTVLVDGGTRRRKVSVRHLEPLDQTLDVAEGASHDAVAGQFKRLNLPLWERKAKSAAAKPVQKRGKAAGISEKKAK